MARNMAARWGMSQGIGPVRIIGNDAEVFLGRDLASMASVSPQTLDTLDAEIRMLVEEGQRIAQDQAHERRARDWSSSPTGSRSSRRWRASVLARAARPAASQVRRRPCSRVAGGSGVLT